ncbi:MAG: DUF1697 domain-containing protein [Bryobacterales bacterium]|nr:DUF1697 domain-containing protein [Bryobacterales bacterium]
MSLVVMLRGVNVGGHRRFRPSLLAHELRHLDIVSIGATGTFVIRSRMTRAHARYEIAQRLPFDTEIMICTGHDVLKLVALDYFASHPQAPDVIQFVSLLSRRPRVRPSLPLQLPADSEWAVRVLGVEGRFVIGMHRREMRAIRYLGELDRIFGIPATTRSWSTIQAIAKVLRPTE